MPDEDPISDEVPSDDEPAHAHAHPAREVFRTLIVGEEHGGKRLDRFLNEAESTLSRARAKAMIEGGEVRVDGRRPRKGDAVTAGSHIELLTAPPPRDFSPLAESSLGIPVRYEDARVAVLDKPAGMPTHPLRPDESGTLANAVVAHYPETLEVGFARREPGLLHRLDTDTSGLVLVARDANAFEYLRAKSKSGGITKKYLALVEGEVVAEGRVDYPLVPHRKDPKRVEAVTPNVRLRAGTRTFEAHTRYKPLRVIRAPLGLSDTGDSPGTYTLLEVELESAFRHQVRVHLATVGHPLFGDMLYRGPAPAPTLALARHFLHASELTFTHPSSEQPVHVVSPLPADLARVLEHAG